MTSVNPCLLVCLVIPYECINDRGNPRVYPVGDPPRGFTLDPPLKRIHPWDFHISKFGTRRDQNKSTCSVIQMRVFKNLDSTSYCGAAPIERTQPSVVPNTCYPDTLLPFVVCVLEPDKENRLISIRVFSLRIELCFKLAEILSKNTDLRREREWRWLFCTGFEWCVKWRDSVVASMKIQQI